MTVVGVHHNIKRIWHIGESVAGTLCLVAIGYFYIMIYHGVRRCKMAAISQATALVRAKQEIKVTKRAGLITVALTLSFAPLLVIGATKDLFPVLSRGKALHLAETLVQLISLANPLIYFYRDRRFRKPALELLRLRKPEAIPAASSGCGAVYQTKRSARYTASCPRTTTCHGVLSLQTICIVRTSSSFRLS